MNLMRLLCQEHVQNPYPNIQDPYPNIQDASLVPRLYMGMTGMQVLSLDSSFTILHWTNLSSLTGTFLFWKPHFSGCWP